MEPKYTEVVKLLIQHPEDAAPYLVAVDHKGNEYYLTYSDTDLSQGAVETRHLRLDKIAP